MNQITLNDDEQDCLQELMNISYGSATAAISEILDAFATLQIPSIQIFPSQQLQSHLTEKIAESEKQYVSTQMINGLLDGENLLIMNEESAYNLAKEFGLSEDEIDLDAILDILLETTNILSSSTIGRFVHELNTNVSFEPPSIQKLDNINKLDNTYLQGYQQIIAISTELEFKEQKISAEMLLLTKDESIVWLKKQLNLILDDF